MEAEYPLQLFTLSISFHVYRQNVGCCFMFPCGTLEILLYVRNPEGMIEEKGNLNATAAYCTIWMHQVIYSHFLVKKNIMLNGAVIDFKVKIYN